MRKAGRALLAGLLLALAAPGGASGADLLLLPRTDSDPAPATYLAGGTQPWPEELKRQLDEHADILTLGINIDWLRETGVDPAPYVEAIAVTGRAVREERIPGAVVHVGRINGKTMPVGVGHGMTDPQRRGLRYSTRYSLHDLTGPVLTVPLTFFAALERRLTLDSTVAEHLPELGETALGAVTVAQLLRHDSGLPGAWPVDEPLDGREGVLRALTAWQDEDLAGTETARPSPLNYALLGLILEATSGEGLPEQAARMLQGAGHTGVEDSEFGYHVGTRARIAPGRYSTRLRRMVWAEPEEPVAEALAPGAGHWGLIASAPALEGIVQRYLVGSALFRGWAGRGAIPIADEPAGGAARLMGSGVMAGRFGPDSFGWDSPTGSSIWLLPGQDSAFIIFLSNADHPDGAHSGADDPRNEVLPLLARSLGWQEDPSPAGESTGQGAP